MPMADTTFNIAMQVTNLLKIYVISTRYTLKILKLTWKRCQLTHVCQMSSWILEQFFWYYAKTPRFFFTFSFPRLTQCYFTYLLEIALIFWKILLFWVTQKYYWVTLGTMNKYAFPAINVQKKVPLHYP